MVTKSKDEAPFKISVSQLYEQRYHRYFTSKSLKTFKNMECIDFREKTSKRAAHTKINTNLTVQVVCYNGI